MSAIFLHSTTNLQLGVELVFLGTYPNSTLDSVDRVSCAKVSNQGVNEGKQKSRGGVTLLKKGKKKVRNMLIVPQFFFQNLTFFFTFVIRFVMQCIILYKALLFLNAGSHLVFYDTFYLIFYSNFKLQCPFFQVQIELNFSCQTV